MNWQLHEAGLDITDKDECSEIGITKKKVFTGRKVLGMLNCVFWSRNMTSKTKLSVIVHWKIYYIEQRPGPYRKKKIS